MTSKHQSPFKEGEVLRIKKRLLDSARRHHAENIVKREALNALFGDDWFESEMLNADLGDDESSADLNELLNEHLLEQAASSRAMVCGEPGEHPALEMGLFAGAPSYNVPTSSKPHPEARETKHGAYEPHNRPPVLRAKLGVNAKSSRSNRRAHSLSTPGRAGLVASFSLSHAVSVAAINKLHPDLDHEQIEKLLRTDAFIQKLAREYQGTGELPDWAKFVSPEMKQFFRIFHQCQKPNSKIITIRLDHKTAEAALAASRGPANYLAEIIKRTLPKLGIETDIAFNLEFNHTGRTENHPAHIHGALCVPDDKVDEVTAALRRALSEGYRQRYNNLAVHIETPRNARWWAAYCVKEYAITIIKLKAVHGRKNRPDYSTHAVTQEAKTFYEQMGAWLDA
jgi:hypothetical protein